MSTLLLEVTCMVHVYDKLGHVRRQSYNFYDIRNSRISNNANNGQHYT